MSAPVLDAELAGVVAQARELLALLTALEPEQLDADDWADLRERAHALADFRSRLFTLLEQRPPAV